MIAYEQDVLEWANEQAQLLRDRQFELLDIEHLAEEIEDVGKSEQRELASRMAALIAHLLKWEYQPERRGKSWLRTIQTQRRAIALHLKEVPSLKPRLADPDWLDKVWNDAVSIAVNETGIADFPELFCWQMDELLGDDWLPGEQ
ncbi:DUF29 domain-containing protein [Ectothiorhodospiraceae bacterium BW-2]|nr:DUF29 domain-containing protein [Ectothiorhodospiraceae bacterium BW-2]